MQKFFKYLLVSLVTVIFTLSYSSHANKEDSQPQITTDYNHLFEKIIEITKDNYVEEIDDEKLFYAAYDGMLRELDPHSGFMNPDDYKEINIQTSGEFGGVGIEITMEKGLIKVISPLDDTPAYEAGIKAADYITMIDGEAVRNLNINQAVQKIRGPKGSSVELTIIRVGEEKPLVISVKRAAIKIKSVKSRIIQDNIAYARITSFSQNTTAHLEKKLQEMREEIGEDIKGVVLDLRNNPGGLLDQAVGVSELFLDGGVVVSTKGRNRNATEIFNAALGDIMSDTAIVVLINQGSASASEIVAGALQDHKRAVIIGTKSFGKGSVQTVIPLGNKLGMRLTTSRYYTPSGRSIQAQGIEPDIFVPQSKIEVSQRNYISEANLSGHLTDKSQDDDNAVSDSKYIEDLYQTDYQLARAVDLLSAIKVISK